MPHHQTRRMIRIETAYLRLLAAALTEAHRETMRLGAPLATSAEVGHLLKQRRAAWRGPLETRRDRLHAGNVINERTPR